MKSQYFKHVNEPTRARLWPPSLTHLSKSITKVYALICTRDYIQLTIHHRQYTTIMQRRFKISMRVHYSPLLKVQFTDNANSAMVLGENKVVTEAIKLS